MVTDPLLSLIIPAYNEESRLPATLARISDALEVRGEPYEVLVVVNGSTDRTEDVVKAAAQRDSNIKLIVTPLAGKGRAVRIGVSEARGDRIVFADADLSTPIEEVIGLTDRLSARHQVVIASREGAGARRVGEPYTRHLMGRVFNLLVQALAVPGIQDTQCGFKAFTRACAHDVFSRQRVVGFGFDVEVLYVARMLGYGIKEVPVTWEYAASSRVDPLRDTIRMFRDVLRVRLNALRGEYA
ncbi:MAG: glycosyltransferase family 2 protein [Chloroflexi bacterium]|nr:glycosyltransferase family 2 protein [Chloroflexota bacterium]